MTFPPYSVLPERRNKKNSNTQVNIEPNICPGILLLNIDSVYLYLNINNKCYLKTPQWDYTRISKILYFSIKISKQNGLFE